MTSSPSRTRPPTHRHRAVTVLPILASGWWVQAWGHSLHARDLVVFIIMYLATGLGVTVGFHRLFTHRSFKARRPVVALLAILGSAAIEGP